jgi:hypothetical protein
MDGNRADYLLGWMFFRNTPILQQPFGANWPYGMDMSSSIIYPDGAPLMALVLKPLRVAGRRFADQVLAERRDRDAGPVA